MNYICIFFITIFLSSCSPKIETISEIEGDSLEQQMITAYNTGVKALEEGDVLYATKKFNEAELLYPQSKWAPQSSLMAAYAYYTQGYYNDSILELKRYKKVYSQWNNLDYVNYLLAMNYYESIVDEKKDLKPLVEAKKYFEIIIKEYEETDYALDAEYKIQLIQDILAAKEIYIARHYMKSEKWIAAINRLKGLINEYQTTIYTEEALHRLVEVYYIIGLEFEAKKYAKILGTNYQSGSWYKQSYQLFNEDYYAKKKPIKKNNKKKKLIEKIKTFF